MSYIYAYPAFSTITVPTQFLDNYGIPIRGILNYARVDDFRVIMTRYGADDYKPKIEGSYIWGPLTNNNTIGEAVIKGGSLLNTASINRLLIEQGTVDNRGFINCAYVDQGYFINYGTIRELFVDGGSFDNYGQVQVLYKVRKNQFVYTDLGNNQEYIVNQYSNINPYHNYTQNPQEPNSYQNVSESRLTSPRGERISNQFIDDATFYGAFRYEIESDALDDTLSGSVPDDDTESDTNEPPSTQEEENQNERTEIESEIEEGEATNECANIKKTFSLESSDSLKGLLCRICFEPVKGREPVSTACGHIYCKKCLSKSVRGEAQRKCPTCNMILPKHNMYHRIFI